MMAASISSTIKGEFRFLEQDFDFQVVEIENGGWGGRVVYKNGTTGIRIVFEHRSCFLFVFIFPLVDGEMIDNVQPITDVSPITCFDLQDYLDTETRMKPTYDYPEGSPFDDEQQGLARYFREFAVRLRKYGLPLLIGDFGDVGRAEATLRLRARNLRKSGARR